MLSLRPHPAWQPLWIPRAPYPVVCLFVSVCPVIARRDPSNDNYSAWGSAAPNSHNNKNNAGYQRECRSKPVVVIGVVVLLPSHLYGTDLNNKGDCLGGSCRLETIKDDRYKYQKERKREREKETGEESGIGESNEDKTMGEENGHTNGHHNEADVGENNAAVSDSGLHENEDDEMITAMSTQALELKLKTLRDQSNKHSQALTQKLATSQSGQNLLHIGSSLSTLPPDLHALLTQLHPVVTAAESTEKQHLQALQKLVSCGNEIRSERRRVEHARDCSDLYSDLLSAEKDIKRFSGMRKRNVLIVPDNTTGASGVGEASNDGALGESKGVIDRSAGRQMDD